MRAVRSAALVVTTLVALSSVTAGAAAKSQPPPPKWVRQVLDALPTITKGEGAEDIEGRAAGRTDSIDNAFVFDLGAGYFSNDLTSGDNLDEILTLYASRGTAWLDVADPSFHDRLPPGKRFATIPVADLTATGVASTDPNVWFAPLYALLGVRHVEPKPLQGAGYHVYEFGLDLAAAKRAVPPAVRPGFLHAYGQIPIGKRTTATGRVEIDDDHFVRDFEARFDVRAIPHDLRLTVDFTLDTVNTSVDMVIPPDSVSVPIDSVPGLRQQLQKLTGSTPTTNPVTGSS